MTPRRIGLVLGLGCLAACVTIPDGQRSDPSAPSPNAGDAVPPATHVDGVDVNPVSSLAGHGRVLDWSFNRVTGRSNFGVAPYKILAAAGGPTPVDWNIVTGAPVTASPATYGPGWTTNSTSDVLYFAVNGTGTGKGITGGASATAPNSNLFALTNLYTSTPTLKWSASLTNGVNRNAITVSLDGSKVYVLDSGGKLYCYTAAGSGTAGATCSGFSTFTASSTVNGSSPWYDFTSGDVYFGDDAGNVYRINGSTGAQKWSFKPGPSGTYQTAIKSSPVVFNGYVYIGDDYGQLFRILDYSTGSPTAGTSDVAIFNVCSAIGSTAPCPAGWQIRASIAYDTTNNHVYAVANDYVFELNGTSSWSQTSASPKHLSSGGTGPMQSTPVLDYTHGYVYTAFNNKLFKIAYPFAGSNTSGFYATSMANGNGGSTDVVDSPLPWTDPSLSGDAQSVVYIGDSAGYTERFNCTTQAGTTALDGETSNGGGAYGNLIDTSEILDWASGNVNFGYSTSSGTGGLVQYPLTSTNYVCPTGKTKLCTQSNGPANTCAKGAATYGQACRECCTNTDCTGGKSCSNGTCITACTGTGAGTCATVPNATATCNTDGSCTYSCNTGWGNCDSSIATNGCNIDLQNDVNNCGACNTACSNSHIPSPICVAGVCSGHCADGYVDCNGNRQSDGCETGANNSSCCGGAACSTGSTCYDNGSTGTCVTGQSTQAYDSNSEHSNVTASCPTGQVITGITFGDYGTPDGNGGQGWTATQCGGTDSTACGNTPGCTMSGGTCVTTCSTFSTSGTCVGTKGCTWESSRSPAQCVATQSPCATGNTSAACALLPWCTWSGSACLAYNCDQYTTSATCTASTTNGCAWNSATGTCTLGLCQSTTANASSSACAAVGSFCTWDTSSNSCVGTVGFLHDYNTAPNNKISSGNCALDVSGNFRTTHCLNASSCTVYGQNGAFCGSTTSPTLTACVTDPTSSATLPLSSVYPSDPCTGVYKRLYMQVTCGPNATTAAFKRVFVSTTSFKGDFGQSGTATAAGAIAIADAECASEASTNGLTGTFKAYLGATGVRTAANVTSSTAAYYRVDGTTFLDTGLTGALSGGVGITTNAATVTLSSRKVWTGFTSAGGISTNTCGSWTNSTGSQNGAYGTSDSAAAAWTQTGNQGCNSSAYIYCVEQ